MEEYLEGVTEAAFKREFEQDEHIVKSLPFLATALGIVVAIFAQLAPRMLTLSKPAAIVLYCVLAVSAVSFLRLVWLMFQLVRARVYVSPPNEEGIVKWGRDLVAFHTRPGRSKAAANDLAKADLRSMMVDTYAKAAAHNHRANSEKYRWRTKCFTALVGLIALASMAAGVILVDKITARIKLRGERDAQERSQSYKPAAGPSGQARSPNGALRGSAGQAPPGATANENRNSGRPAYGAAGAGGLDNDRRKKSDHTAAANDGTAAPAARVREKERPSAHSAPLT